MTALNKIHIPEFTHVISYDLGSPGQGYEKLIKTINELGKTRHCLLFTWLLKADVDMSATDVRDFLIEHLDANDKLIVTSIISGNVQDVQAAAVSGEDLELD